MSLLNPSNAPVRCLQARAVRLAVIPVKAGTRALAPPTPPAGPPVQSGSLVAAQTWVPAFAEMHGDPGPLPATY